MGSPQTGASRGLARGRGLWRAGGAGATLAPMALLATTVAVASGAALGAVARYGVGWLAARVGAAGWHGVLAANVAGSALLGAVTALALRGDLPPLAEAALGTGLCGALTTFSSFSLDNGLLLLEGRYVVLAANVALTLAGGLGALLLILRLLP